jgi:hypothetical protein
MSFQRRAIVSTERFNRLLKIANLDPVQFSYDMEIENYYNVYLNDRVKRDFLTQVSMLENERLLTHEIRNRKGMFWGQTFDLVVGQPVRIDLLDPRASTGYTGNISIAARTSVFKVRLVNKGTGDLLYSLNVQDTGSALLPAPPAHSVVEHEATIERYEVINLRAIGSNAQVNVAVEI